jgi:hypothetical protein
MGFRNKYSIFPYLYTTYFNIELVISLACCTVTVEVGLITVISGTVGSLLDSLLELLCLVGLKGLGCLCKLMSLGESLACRWTWSSIDALLIGIYGVGFDVVTLVSSTVVRVKGGSLETLAKKIVISWLSLIPC